MTWEDLQHQETEDLIRFIRHKEQVDYLQLAELSFVVFTFRFRNEIIDKCRKIAKNWRLDQDTADLIAEKTFERFWKYPLGFEKSRCGSLALDTCVKLYLFRIAQRCFFDYHREASGGNKSPYSGEEKPLAELPSVDMSNFPKDKADDLKKIYQQIEAALSRLGPKHKIIYLTYKAYEKEGYKLPRHLLKKLREDLQLNQNSIRVYKKEAFDIIQQILKENATK